MGFIQYRRRNRVDHHSPQTGITSTQQHSWKEEVMEELEGMSWHLKPPEQTSVRVPSRVAVNERLNRSNHKTPIEEVAATVGRLFSMMKTKKLPQKGNYSRRRSDWDD
ncbi:hypothetical protein Tco_0938591 [Tanacetum coccineum]|uniref:Uncharacterized protein n=1 Tax=Tanacetum coccineum TaxID=301880 RepID=A0ABQ5DHM9_9ASTR